MLNPTQPIKEIDDVFYSLPGKFFKLRPQSIAEKKHTVPTN